MTNFSRGLFAREGDNQDSFLRRNDLPATRLRQAGEIRFKSRFFLPAGKVFLLSATILGVICFSSLSASNRSMKPDIDLKYCEGSIKKNKQELLKSLLGDSTLKAAFTVRTLDENDHPVSTIQGNFLFHRPAKLLWSTGKSNQSVILIKNGVYSDYEGDLGTLQEFPLKDLSMPLYDLLNSEKIDQFLINTLDKSHLQVEIPGKDLRFTIKHKDQIILAISYQNQFNEKVEIIFDNFKKGLIIPDELFRINYPAGTTIIKSTLPRKNKE